ncbi:MAG: T9SS type A sorting domain-containing protein [Bacteroidota bacterium]|nr:T9SS type A sorting domain-containing protein [Bacteroidota bacterium]
MKTLIYSLQRFCLLIFCLFFLSIVTVNAQDAWTQKADVGGGLRNDGVGFSIEDKGYIGLGTNQFDFWEYDPSTDTWTQKANYPGAAPKEAVGFSIGNKGYVGTGETPFNIPVDEFWEYNPTTNTWTQKADFAGGVRIQAVGLSIGNKGYLGTGQEPFAQVWDDFWEYDPLTDMWTQKADFPSGELFGATGFSLNGKGYIGTGALFNSNTDEFWEYNPSTDTWTQKADFGGGPRSFAFSFSVGNKGYIGTGSALDDFWEYDPSTDTWTQRADFGGGNRTKAVGFSIGCKGYAGTGGFDDFWQYTPLNALGVDLGNDTIVCNDTCITLDAGSGDTFIWSTGQEYQTIVVCESGTFFVDVTDAFGCVGTDTIVVTFCPEVNILADTLQTHVLLDAGQYFSYNWSTGETTQTIAVTDSGMYVVTVTDTNGCTKMDSILLEPYLNVYIGEDMGISPGGSVTLDAGWPGSSYLWNTGATTKTIIVSNPGTYWVDVINSFGWKGSDTIVLYEATGIAENKDIFYWGIYPNPASKQITVSGKFSGKELTLNIRDITGRILIHHTEMQQETEGEFKIQLPLENQAAGIYFIELITEKHTAIKKLVLR